MFLLNIRIYIIINICTVTFVTNYCSTIKRLLNDHKQCLYTFKQEKVSPLMARKFLAEVSSRQIRVYQSLKLEVIRKYRGWTVGDRVSQVCADKLHTLTRCCPLGKRVTHMIATVLRYRTANQADRSKNYLTGNNIIASRNELRVEWTGQ